MDNSTSNENMTVTSRGPKLTEDELISIYARQIYGHYYETIFPITMVVCVLGLVTNIFNIAVFTRKHMINSLNFLLTALSIFDIILISSQLPYTVHHLFGFRSQFSYSWVQSYIFLIFLELFGTMVCNWLAVIIGIWRNLTVRFPVHANRWCSLTRAKIAIGVLVVLGLAISSPIFALLKINETYLYDKFLYTKGFTEFASKNDGRNLKTFWGGLLIMTFVPCVLLIAINIMLIVNVCGFLKRQRNTITDKAGDVRKRERRSYRITLMITVILLLFVANNLPDSALVLVAFFDIGDKKTQDDIRRVTDFLRVFSMLNNSVSFFVYYFLGERRFKRTFLSIFCSRFVKNTYSPGKRRSSSETVSTQSLDNETGHRDAYAEAPL